MYMVYIGGIYMYDTYMFIHMYDVYILYNAYVYIHAVCIIYKYMYYI